MTFRLRKPTNRYSLFHTEYRESDRLDLKNIAKEFAEVFGISYERMKVKASGVSFSTDDSDFQGNSTTTDYVETWIILRWAEVYHEIDYYESPHLTQKENL